MFLVSVGRAFLPAEVTLADRNVCLTAVLLWTFLREKWFPRSLADVARRVRRYGATLRNGNVGTGPIMRPDQKRRKNKAETAREDETGPGGMRGAIRGRRMWEDRGGGLSAWRPTLRVIQAFQPREYSYVAGFTWDFVSCIAVLQFLPARGRCRDRIGGSPGASPNGWSWPARVAYDFGRNHHCFPYRIRSQRPVRKLARHAVAR